MKKRILPLLCLLLLLSLWCNDATAFQPILSSCHRHVVVIQHRRDASLCAFGNAYLESLEQQTRQQALQMETLQSIDDWMPSIDDQSEREKDDDDTDDQENFSKAKELMKQTKEAGTAGIISFAMVQLGFWSLSLVVALAMYVRINGHPPDLTNSEELAQVAAEALAYVNIARLAAPLRIALALSSTPWIQKHLLDRFRGARKEESDKEP